MTLSRCSLLLPGYHLEDFPTHLVGDRAAELLSAWTALWHPALLAMTGQMPTWYPAATPPDPDTLDGVLVVAPQLSRERLPTGWVERFAETHSRNPPLLEATPRRRDTVRPILEAASVDPNAVDPDLVGDFFALGYAFLQVELLTRVMRHTTLLSTEKFAEVAVTAARSAMAGDSATTKDQIAQALDLLADARNHYYSVDYYLLDVTLVAPTTMGEALRAKLAEGSPTSLLASGALIEQMAAEHPDTLAELRRAIDRGTACVIGGQRDSSAPGFRSPEAMLAEFIAGEEIYQH